MSRSSDGSLAARWSAFWFDDIPPHSYALLRILVGLLGITTILELTPLSAFWDLEGFVPVVGGGLGLKSIAVSLGVANLAARALFVASLVVYACMAVGFQSKLAVACSFAASLLQPHWNYLPTSAAPGVLHNVLFCLMWADCGVVWSVDSRRARLASTDTTRCAIWPLRLVRFQVALIYLNSGLWKLYNAHWRNGTAVHFVLYNNIFRRFPLEIPQSLDWVTTALTYSVLVWELSFALLILYRPTRRIALITGVLMHLGMTLALEVGQFPWVMLAAYTAFLEPAYVAELPSRVRRMFFRQSLTSS